ncbi:DNA phosphorothioation-dependent restriction protein DptF [Azonexus sp. IMCC34842]|uniref:DNA phosphorothioation-dependent restriction protein DptF n=1 Tax=Azonexus sp. IMCC34842 TaxID=3420950 RepID=UPI003D0E51EE
MDLTLRDALCVLSKASPFSVKTLSDKPRDSLDDAKDWLYIEQDIERDFRKILSTLVPGEIVFLCGSSGDGKSEILARCHEQYRNRVRFHLDGTHSFSPRQSAIDALDQLFDESHAGSKPLAVGINIGMLANYCKEGASRHSLVKYAIENFLNGKNTDTAYHFFDFENYPKFQFNTNSDSHSKFAKQLMMRLTEPSDKNPFYVLSQKDDLEQTDPLLSANFKLLALGCVQNAIIENMFKVRLIKDKFITARALLDFIYQLLLGNKYLPDNLFGASDNELIQRMGDFDPALLHTRALDQFLLRFELGLPNVELSVFIDHLQKNRLMPEFKGEVAVGAGSLIRLFYLLLDQSIGNNFHHQFTEDFVDELLDGYSKVWLLHNDYDGSSEAKLALRPFYGNELINGIYRYANRNAPWLQKGEVFLGKSGALQLAAPVEVKVNFASIQCKTSASVSRFWASLKVSDKELEPIAVNLNLFELIFKLNRGYRPNKYDKSAVVLLDELVEKIREVAKQSSVLKIYENRRCYTARLDDDMIEIGGVA